MKVMANPIIRTICALSGCKSGTSEMFSAWARPDKTLFSDSHDGLVSRMLKWIKGMEVSKEKWWRL